MRRADELIKTVQGGERGVGRRATDCGAVISPRWILWGASGGNETKSLSEYAVSERLADMLWRSKRLICHLAIVWLTVFDCRKGSLLARALRV